MRAKTAIIAMLGLAISHHGALAQNPASTSEQTLRPLMTFHGESQTLREIARNPVEVAPGNGQLFDFELEELYEEPTLAAPPGSVPAPFVQTFAPKPFAAVAGVSFEGPGTGLAGFTMTGAPPDMTLAVGPNHIVTWVNSQYAVFNKTGTLLLGPVNGNGLFAGLPNECATTNRGDPILQYDRLANRWILSQFAFAVSGGAPVTPYFQCFAVSTGADPTGSYVRYSVQFSAVTPSGFNDYGKLGVWPDGYYSAYNIFGGSPAGANTGAALCASDRVKMLAGDPSATTLCAPVAFYAGGAAFLPADLDGTTLPSDLTQGGIFLRLSTAPALRYLKLKPNFTTSTVTLTSGFSGVTGTFVELLLPATVRACNGVGGACVAQPGTANLLDTLGDRLMYRLAYRNRGGVESMMVTHSVDPDGAGTRGAALRWYEIRNPLGNPADPVVANRPVLFQNGTFDPGASGNRWMGSIAMDQNGNMMMGYSIANAGAGLKPSIAIAGREVGDPVNTLQSEILALTGTGSQTGTLTRWGDYSTIQIDPVDDSTFWYISQYLAADGSFNWRSRVVSYRFPTPPATLSINDVSIVEGNSGSSNAVFTITRSHTSSAVSVQVDTANGSATSGSDYSALTAQVVNFTAGGSATATVSVPISGDGVLEANETFNVNLSNPSAATISDGTGLGTITNDDAASIAIGDVTQAEGNSGSTNFVFNVTLTNAVQGGFTVPFSTADGTAVQPGDYASNSGSLSFTGSAGEVKTITVAVVGESVLEANETFAANLGTPSNAGVSVSDGTGLGTITNDDSASIAIGDVTLAEGNSGSTNFVFNVTLTGAVQGGFTVPFSTADGTATQPGDYASNSGSLSFTGSAGEVQTVTVAVVGDLVPEADENFVVNLGTATAGVNVSQPQGTGLILNDDLFADISTSISDGASWVVPGQTTAYTVVVSNTSTLIDVAAVAIAQTLPANLSSVSWTCTGSGGATCPPSGSGAIAQTLAMPRSSSLTFVVTATANASGSPPSIDTTVTATVMAPNSDSNTANNSATDSNALILDIIFRNGFD